MAEYRAVAGVGGRDFRRRVFATAPSTIESDLDIALGAAGNDQAGPGGGRRRHRCVHRCLLQRSRSRWRAGAVSIPVIGEGQAALHRRQPPCPSFQRHHHLGSVHSQNSSSGRRAGFGNKLASVRATGVGVMALSNDCLGRMIDEAIKAVKERAPKRSSWAAPARRKPAGGDQRRGSRGSRRFRADHRSGAGRLRLCEACVATGLRHSKIAYPTNRQRPARISVSPRLL